MVTSLAAIPIAATITQRKLKTIRIRRRRRKSEVGARRRWRQSKHWLSSLWVNGCSWITLLLLLRCLFLLLLPFLWMTLECRRVLVKVGRKWCSTCIPIPNAVMGFSPLQSLLRKHMWMGLVSFKHFLNISNGFCLLFFFSECMICTVFYRFMFLNDMLMWVLLLGVS